MPTVGDFTTIVGPYVPKLKLGPVMPSPRKGTIPFYNQSNLQLLQEKVDKLIALGVLAKPEDAGVDVVFVSPSFLVKKSNGGGTIPYYCI